MISPNHFGCTNSSPPSSAAPPRRERGERVHERRAIHERHAVRGAVLDLVVPRCEVDPQLAGGIRHRRVAHDQVLPRRERAVLRSTVMYTASFAPFTNGSVCPAKLTEPVPLLKISTNSAVSVPTSSYSTSLITSCPVPPPPPPGAVNEPSSKRPEFVEYAWSSSSPPTTSRPFFT
jgi:hypothetical protein